MHFSSYVKSLSRILAEDRNQPFLLWRLHCTNNFSAISRHIRRSKYSGHDRIASLVRSSRISAMWPSANCFLLCCPPRYLLTSLLLRKLPTTAIPLYHARVKNASTIDHFLIAVSSVNSARRPFHATTVIGYSSPSLLAPPLGGIPNLSASF